MTHEPLKRKNAVPDGFPLSERFLAALGMAHEWHRGQYRKVPDNEQPTIPYVSHLLGVASIALEFGATEDEAIAALLHDALEDGPDYMGYDASILEKEIKRQFGDDVAHIVDAATDDRSKPHEPKAPWAARKARYMGQLKAKTNASALLVTASDKLHNYSV